MRRALLLLPVLVAAGCGGGGHPAATVSGDPLVAAADATTKQGSEKLALDAKVDLSGQSLSLGGTGAFNDKAHEGQLHLNFTAGLAGSSTLDEIFKDNVIWLRSPLLAGSLPKGKQWLKVDLAKEAQALGFDLKALTGQTPSDALAKLHFHGHVTTVGKETVDGVETTHYTEALGLTDQTTKARYKSVDAWVDDQGLVRKVRLDYTTPVTGSQPAHTVVTMTFSDFGVPVSVTPPPPGEVVDASKQGHA
jgi:hypothetical protein